MDISYFSEWGHIYVVHFGAWVTFLLAATAHRKGTPKPEKIPRMLLATIVLASIAAIFSSHSHAHYLSHFTKK